MIGPRVITELSAEAETDCRIRSVVLRVLPDPAAGTPAIECNGLVLPDHDYVSESLVEIQCDWQALVDALRSAGAEIR